MRIQARAVCDENGEDEAPRAFSTLFSQLATPATRDRKLYPTLNPGRFLYIVLKVIRKKLFLTFTTPFKKKGVETHQG